MSPRPFVVLVFVSLLLAPAAAASAADPGPSSDRSVASGSTPDASTTDDGAGIVAAFPNPVAHRDVGEFVVLSFPTPTHVGNWTFTDGKTTVPLGNRTVHGRVVVATDVAPARRTYANVTRDSAGDHARNTAFVHAPALALSNAGETLSLENASGAIVASFTYDDAPDGELARDDGFHALGETDHAPWTTNDVDARAFLTPDTPVPLAPIRRADERIALAGYTFASKRVARALERAAARGVSVNVLVDDAPVGGVTSRQRRVLDRLDDAGVAVRALGGPRARYDFQHAKYLVADDTAVVLTENWKPSGTGGHANRGWGVVVADAAVADDLAHVFASDWDAPDARAWSNVAEDVAIDPEPAANASYPTAIRARSVTADSVTVVTAPDNAERVLTATLRNATDRVRVIQMTADRDGVLLGEAITAARRGVDVRILLSSAWYAREDNARVVDALNALADRDDLPLEARLVDPNGQFRKVHAKGVVVDDRVVLGSINWNDHSLRENRELAVVLHGDAVAAYYADAFDADWERGHGTPVPWWLGVAAALAVVVLLVVLKRHVTLSEHS